MSWLKLDVFLAMAAYGLIVGLVLLGKWKAKRKSDSLLSDEIVNNSDKISVIVPFRNETKNLPNLIQSIQNLQTFPLEFIFVNDHSEDDSESILEKTNLDFTFQLVNLVNEEAGKKAAIRKGVELAKGSFILTWDADITPFHSYFSELEKYSWASLSILPVEMRDSKWASGFFAWDYQLQTQTSLSMAGWARPILASGANLLFEKEAFIYAEEHRTDGYLSSGDDQFLLSAFRKSGKSIQNLVSKELTVITGSPLTITDGLSQRSRWLGKSKAVKDNLANLFGVFVLVLQLSYYAFAFHQLWIGNFGATIVMILIKSELDAFICTYKFQEQFNTFQVFVYELVFPVYIFVLLFNSIFKIQTWKGRSSKNAI
jgi:biofilm PGA synthesis N-glycosyltransferase PgaC